MKVNTLTVSLLKFHRLAVCPSDPVGFFLFFFVDFAQPHLIPIARLATSLLILAQLVSRLNFPAGDVRHGVVFLLRAGDLDFANL
jgi:hypothetical protein